MTNVETKIEGNKLIITVDLSQNQGPSSTGKTDGIASSHGNVPVEGAPGNVRIGLNVYRIRAKVG